MLDPEDQQQLERNIEQRNTSLHRTVSIAIVGVCVILVAAYINNVPGYVTGYVMIVLCVSYSMFLLYNALVFHNSAKLLRQRARINEREFTDSMEAFLESLERKN